MLKSQKCLLFRPVFVKSLHLFCLKFGGSLFFGVTNIQQKPPVKTGFQKNLPKTLQKPLFFLKKSIESSFFVCHTRLYDKPKKFPNRFQPILKTTFIRLMSIQVHLPHSSSVKKFEKKVDILTLAKDIDSSLAENTVGAFVNSESEISDVRRILEDQDRVELVSIPSPAGLEVVRHSAAHVLAQAVQELWPSTKVTIGPVIADGFYYDFDRKQPFTPEDLKVIEKKMKEIMAQKLPITREVWPSSQAINTFRKMKELYKVELIEELKDTSVSIYKQGGWMDLCRGPHVQHLGQIGAVKVLHTSASYWRGDENKASLQRIYATAFHSQKELDEYLTLLEQAKQRDHRKTGKEMNLFYFDEHSPGQPFFKKSGAFIYESLKNFLREKYSQHGYEEVISPQIYSKDLFVQSEHYHFYKKNMYETTTTDGRQAFLKPMNCPGHCLLYKSQKWSYKDLPWRPADFGRLHRFERSGTLHGLTRVRGFCQDDAHIFCTMEQLNQEIQKFLHLLGDIYSVLGLTAFQVTLCTRPDQRMGEDKVWDQAEQALASALEATKTPFKKDIGGGAFYGPKLDILFTDSLKRQWQLGTLQCDFNLPEAFRLSYRDKDNAHKPPVLLHRAVLGSIERFMGIYLEHSGGWLPLWVSPIQAVILSLSKDLEDYSQEIFQLLSKSLRVEKDFSSQSLGYKIRQARLRRIPYMVIIGKKEVAAKNISVRAGGKENFTLPAESFLKQVTDKVLKKETDYAL